jgi:serine/threonine protein kinase
MDGSLLQQFARGKRVFGLIRADAESFRRYWVVSILLSNLLWGVTYRDLKMDNTLLDDLDPPRIKLCDFGFAKWWTDKPCMNTITGGRQQGYGAAIVQGQQAAMLLHCRLPGVVPDPASDIAREPVAALPKLLGSKPQQQQPTAAGARASTC